MSRTVQEDDTQKRILHAAGEAFAELGFKDATVREICRRAGANLASVNYYFGDKERLYAAVIRYAHECQADGDVPPQWDDRMPPEAKLRAFVRATMLHMLAVKEVAWHDRIMLREMLEPTGACREFVEDFVRPHFEQLLSILDEMVPAETPQHKRHQLGFSIIGQCVFYRFHDGVARMLLGDEEMREHFSPEVLADHIASVALAFLGREPLFDASNQEDSNHRSPSTEH